MAGILPERYVAPELVGRGGMGEIYRAEDGTLGRVVAIKLLADRFAADENVRARFTREALTAARLSSSPHTVTIFDVGEWEDRPYIVMEYLPGGSIADRLEAEGAQPPGRVLAWLDGAAQALDAAHRQGVVHRDVKPANLLFDADGEVHVADFGIASAAGLDSLTQAGTVLGTAGYLAPEQARGERATDASDRYALGVVAYELLAGRRPFERESPTAEAVAHANDEPPPISSVTGGLPPALDAVFERALEKDPDRRYATCGELVADLRAAFRDEAATTRAHAIPPPARAQAPAPRAQPAARSRGRSSSRWPVALGLALLLALGAGAVAAAVLADEDGGTTQSTVERTITTQGETVTVTTEVESPPPPPPPPSPPPAPPPAPPPSPPAASGSASELNDQGFQRMQAGDYEGALPLLEQAVAASRGSGTLTEAYAAYNLAYTRFQLDSCDGVLDLLARSEAVQGQRGEIDELRGQAQQACEEDG